ncbi:hypothetical protein MJH12_10475 [bacterium]|nr:hypothetical protein [bacterium]
MEYQNRLTTLKEFSKHYDYDCNYLEDILETSSTSFEKYENFLPMSYHREQSKVEIYFTCKLASMKSLDCGPCLELTAKMAAEAGMDSNLIKLCLGQSEQLPLDLKEIYDYSQSVLKNEGLSEDIYRGLQEEHGKEVMVELALAIVSAQVFPTLKRAMGQFQSSCIVIDL